MEKLCCSHLVRRGRTLICPLSLTTALSLLQQIKFLSGVHVDDWFPEDLVQEYLMESRYQDYSLSYYDPYQGNHCAVGTFAAGLPVVATPFGPTGAHLGKISSLRTGVSFRLGASLLTVLLSVSFHVY